MVGVTRTIHKCGLTRDDAGKFYAETAQLVYGQVEGTTAQTNNEATSAIRKSPPRRTNITRPEPKDREVMGWTPSASDHGVTSP